MPEPKPPQRSKENTEKKELTQQQLEGLLKVQIVPWVSREHFFSELRITIRSFLAANGIKLK